MSEKRFVYGRAFAINSDDSLPCITDRQDEKDYIRMSDLVDLLNEQQATIRKLQDLCGESDGENAKLRIENEQLKQKVDFYKYFQKDARELEKENEQLKEENESLKQRIRDMNHNGCGFDE